ncbi:MAG: SCP2 sterol-binding domain-containing protein, partial [Lachnospiraceae bacterium]|nr:SCP2 sterol-binding domain-containing protein [Lachnospiraceae bacterium]
EQLSVYASDDDYVKQQKEDIMELSSLYRNMLGQQTEDTSVELISVLKSHFTPQRNFAAKYSFVIEGQAQPLFVGVREDQIDCHYGEESNVDVIVKMKSTILEEITSGRMTFQRAFTVGDMSAKGQFATLRMLDTIFNF